MSAATSLTSPRAVAYARYSSEQQRAASIDDQLRDCRRRADEEGWIVIREYADPAITDARLPPSHPESSSGRLL